jgi:hypothetical protein
MQLKKFLDTSNFGILFEKNEFFKLSGYGDAIWMIGNQLQAIHSILGMEWVLGLAKEEINNHIIIH